MTPSAVSRSAVGRASGITRLEKGARTFCAPATSPRPPNSPANPNDPSFTICNAASVLVFGTSGFPIIRSNICCHASPPIEPNTPNAIAAGMLTGPVANAAAGMAIPPMVAPVGNRDGLSGGGVFPFDILRISSDDHADGGKPDAPSKYCGGKPPRSRASRGVGGAAGRVGCRKVSLSHAIIDPVLKNHEWPVESPSAE